MSPTLDISGDVSDNPAQDPFSEELSTLEPDSPKRAMPGSEASSRTTSSADSEAPPLAAILKGLGGLTQKADNNSLRFGEEIGGLHKEKAELNPEMTGLTETMDNVTGSKRSQTTSLS